MAVHVVFTKQPYLIKDAVIPDNSKSLTPVVFHLSMAAGSDMARLKAVMLANVAASSGATEFTPMMQASILKAFETGAPAFERTVDKIENLSVSVALARHVGLVPPYDAKGTGPEALPDEAQFPITNGVQFSKVAPYGTLMLISLDVANEIHSMTERATFDARFSKPLSGSSTAGQRRAATTTARRAKPRRGKHGTVDS